MACISVNNNYPHVGGRWHHNYIGGGGGGMGCFSNVGCYREGDQTVCTRKGNINSGQSRSHIIS